MSDLAFPQTSASANTTDWCGMTLRDYFAAKAMQGLIASKEFFDMTSCAREAYEFADVMLEARNGNS
jgi:hypothetical protein